MRSGIRPLLRILLLTAFMLGGAFFGHGFGPSVLQNGSSMRDAAEHELIGAVLGAFFAFLGFFVFWEPPKRH
jgi:hypothetical protein